MGGLLVLGMVGFFARYQKYFERGATSVGARLHYWSSAYQTAIANPLFGSGPGTFSISFKKIKSPETEMAQLTHNDYLEQASDSGIIGFLSYFVFIFGSLSILYRDRLISTDPFYFTIWLGVLGWALQCFFEFSLYVPALAWPAFLFLGWLLGSKRA